MTSEEINAAIERLRSMRTADRDLIFGVCRAFIGDCEVTGDELHYTLIELLEQADPGTHMEVPRDADGMPIHVGDVMCDEDGKSFEVDEITTSKANGWKLFGGYEEGFSEYDPATCRHYHKPTVSEILDELEGLRGTGDYESVVMRAAELAGMLRELMADDDAR